MKVVKILLGVLGALGIGLVGLILACHFNPGLSDTIADFLYKDKQIEAESNEEQTLLSQEALEEADIEDADSLDIPEEEPLGPLPGEEVAPPPPVQEKSLADYGFTQENVLNNVQEYFDDCGKQLAKDKGESTTFYNVVRDSVLLDEILKSYDNESYREGFMNKFMDDYQIEACGWSINTEELQGGYCLVTHTFTR